MKVFKPKRSKIRVLFIACLTLVGFINKSYSQIPGVWSQGSAEGFTPRVYLSSVILNDKIYSFGGYDKDSGALNTLEVYDPILNTWNTPKTTGTPLIRYAHTAAIVNGKMYIIGGRQDSLLSSIDVFNPATNTWSTPQTNGSYYRREFLSSCVISDKIYVIGGLDKFNSSSDVSVFEPTTNTWTKLQTQGFFSSRYAFSCTVVNGKIYVIGGIHRELTNDSITSATVNSVDIFDPTTNTWNALQTTGTFLPRAYHAAILINNNIYIVGSQTSRIDVLNTLTNKWDTVAATGIYEPVSSLGLVERNNSIYAIGGAHDGRLVKATQILTLEPLDVKYHNPSTRTVSIHPNPSTSFAHLNYILDQNSFVSISLYDLLGKGIKVVSGNQDAGQHTILLPTEALVTGLYVCKIQKGDQTEFVNLIVNK